MTWVSGAALHGAASGSSGASCKDTAHIVSSGVVVFFKAADPAVGGVFIGLACIYFTDFFANLKADLPKLGNPGEKALGFFHIGTGLWLLYLMRAVTLDTAVGSTWLK